MSEAMSLYEITATMVEIDDELENGELDDQTHEDMMESLQYLLEQKSNSIIKYIYYLKNRQVAIKNEIERLTKLKKTTENKEKSIKGYITTILQKLKKRKIEFDIGGLSLRKSADSVVIEDATKIPNQYLRQKISVEPDKTKLKEALKSGEIISGCYLNKSKQSLIVK